MAGGGDVLHLAGVKQLAVDEGQLAGGVDEVADSHRRHVGGDGCGDGGQFDAQFAETIGNGHGYSPLGRLR